MLALRTAWEQQHGAGSVVGLAPSAVAAEVLAVGASDSSSKSESWPTNLPASTV